MAIATIVKDFSVRAFHLLTRTIARLDLDLVEKFTYLALLTLLTLRMVPSALAHGGYINIVLLASECMVIVFVLLRRRTNEISHRRYDWLIGFAGMVMPLLVLPGSGRPLVDPALCGMVMVAGFALQMAAKLTLRRSFGVVAANRGVKAGGPYRLIRHPMYLGYTLTHVGFVLAGPLAWNIGVYLLAATLQVMRLLAEERILDGDPAYRALAARTRYRLIPYVF